MYPIANVIGRFFSQANRRNDYFQMIDWLTGARFDSKVFAGRYQHRVGLGPERRNGVAYAPREQAASGAFRAATRSLRTGCCYALSALAAARAHCPPAS
jgi:hypothetical protein